MKTKLPTEWQELSNQLGFQEFTPIQTQLFEPLLAGENLLGVSPTGTGKTLDIIHISENTRLLSHSYAVFCLKKKNK